MEKTLKKLTNAEKETKPASFAAFFVFLLSPFLSIPILFNDLKNGRSKYVSVFIALLFGFLSFRYIPAVTNDKAEYFSAYYKFLNFNFIQFERYILSLRKPDFLFNYFIYLFSKSFLNFNLFFFVITSITVFLIVRFLITVTKEMSFSKRSTASLSFFLFLITLSLSALLSQVRFYLGASVFIWAVYYLLFKKEVWKSIVLFLLTLSIHFSFAFFLPGILLILIFKNINSKLILIISLLFYLSNRLFFFNILEGVLLPENYLNKIEVYRMRDVDYSANAILLHNLRFLWLYLAIGFLIFYKYAKTQLFTLATIVLAFVNLTNQDEFIFGRFSIVFSIFFVLFLIECHVNKKIKPLFFRLFILLFFVSLGTHLLTMRHNIAASFSFESLFSILNIFSYSITPYDFLK